MTSYRVPKTVMTARVVRVIAIFFLVYTGADLTVPEFCGEEMGISRFAQAASSTGIGNDFTFATDASEPRQDAPSERNIRMKTVFVAAPTSYPGMPQPPLLFQN